MKVGMKEKRRREEDMRAIEPSIVGCLDIERTPVWEQLL